jgi:serine/threonine-protein kinase
MKICTRCKMRYPNEATYCFVEGGELAELPDPRIGTLVAGRYVVDEVLGEGGMATVYGGRHKLSDKPVAIKIMNPMLATDVVVRERFRREAKNSQKLAHPNIIEIHDQGDTEDGTAYIVMERLRGEPLSDVIARGPIEVERAMALMAQMSRGIARAHDLGVVHRDIKPENIFICRRDDHGGEVAKILDFGIAKSRHDARLTNQGELFGTPQYMAPERITGTDPGPASDLYSLGVVFYEMLTGELPFHAPDIATFFVMHMTEPPRPIRTKNPRVPKELDALVLSLLAKNQEDRPVDAHAVLRELTAVMDAHQVVEASPPTISEPPPAYDDPPTITMTGIDVWGKRTRVFDQMLAVAYGSRTRAPKELVAVLDSVEKVVDELSEARRQGMEQQAKLEMLDQRGREGRQSRGHAVDALGVDLSRAKEEVRAASAQLTAAEETTKGLVERMKEAQAEIIRWEGRSALSEPYTDLADAYRAAAAVVDEWLELKKVEREARSKLERAEQGVSDLDFQIRELRTALTMHEQQMEQERADCERQLSEIGKQTTNLEEQLIELTSRFTRPLRSLPSLAAHFKELETSPASLAAPASA